MNSSRPTTSVDQLTVPSTELSHRWSARFRVPRQQMAHFRESPALTAGMITFASLSVDWASALGRYLGARIGPGLEVPRRPLRNPRRVFPENSDAENQHILRALWNNLGRSAADFMRTLSSVEWR